MKPNDPVPPCKGRRFRPDGTEYVLERRPVSAQDVCAIASIVGKVVLLGLMLYIVNLEFSYKRFTWAAFEIHGCTQYGTFFNGDHRPHAVWRCEDREFVD